MAEHTVAPKPKPIRVYQPTYQLDPRTPFNSETVQKILRRVVDAELEELEYCEKNVPQACLILAELLRSAIKEQNYDRYRIIVAVTIGQKRAQSVNICHSFLWDPDRDAYVTHNFENVHIYANVVVYGIYLD